MSKSIIDTVLDGIFDADWKGRRGEKLTERELKWVKLFGRSGKTLRNVYIPKGDGQTSEIDVLYITQKGIFVIESKNYSGWIFGNEADRFWTVSLPGGHKERFYSPIMQNRGHIKWLGRFLEGTVPLFSIVAFSERCELKKLTVSDDDVKVIKRDRLYATVRSIWDDAPDVLDEAGVESLYERLQPLTNVSDAVKAAHVADIEAKHKPQARKREPGLAGVPEKPVEVATPTEASTDADAEVCPRCGGTLVLRTAKKGPNAGNQFYGCSNYPKCRFTREA